MADNTAMVTAFIDGNGKLTGQVVVDGQPVANVGIGLVLTGETRYAGHSNLTSFEQVNGLRRSLDSLSDTLLTTIFEVVRQSAVQGALESFQQAMEQTSVPPMEVPAAEAPIEGEVIDPA